MSKSIKLIIGIILILAGAYAIYLWWGDVLALIRGGAGFILIMLGLIFMALLD